jgi:hypothetical protein
VKDSEGALMDFGKANFWVAPASRRGSFKGVKSLRE